MRALAGPCGTVHVFLGRRLGDQPQHERGDRFDVGFAEGELGHPQPFVVSLGFDLLVVVAARITQLLPQKTGPAMMIQLVEEVGHGPFAVALLRRVEVVVQAVA